MLVSDAPLRCKMPLAGTRNPSFCRDELEDVREGKAVMALFALFALLFPVLFELRVVPFVLGRYGSADMAATAKDSAREGGIREELRCPIGTFAGPDSRQCLLRTHQKMCKDQWQSCGALMVPPKRLGVPVAGREELRAGTGRSKLPRRALGSPVVSQGRRAKTLERRATARAERGSRVPAAARSRLSRPLVRAIASWMALVASVSSKGLGLHRGPSRHAQTRVKLGQHRR